jgi:sortase A
LIVSRSEGAVVVGVDGVAPGKRSFPARAARLISLIMMVGGVLAVAWAIVVWVWQDPFTALYTHFEQQKLAAEYKRVVSRAQPVRSVPNTSSLRVELRREAREYAATLRTGHALGQITIGRIGLKMIVVQGTDESSLEKGPGHYATSGLPGEGKLIYIAGHRTTFLAPFAEINNIRIGDYVELAVPYGTFTYRVTRHYVVAADDVAVLENRGSELLRLQACHPRFFATHRYIVDAVPVAVTLPGGKRYRLDSGGAAATTTKAGHRSRAGGKAAGRR